MISASPLTISLAEANSAELRRQAARQRAIGGMQRELDKLELGGPRRHTRLRLMLAAAAAIGVALFASSSAWADPAHLYASPGGSLTSDCQDPGDPCGIGHVLVVASSNADVQLAPGTYHTNSALTLNKPITLHGPVGGPRPEIINYHKGCPSCKNVTLAIEAAGTVVRDLRVAEGSGNGGSAAAIYVDATNNSKPVTLERLVAEGDDDSAIWAQSAVQMRDSLAWAPNNSGRAIHVQDAFVPFSAELENVDAIAGAGGIGLDVPDRCVDNNCVITTTARNSILQGGFDDVSSNGHGGGAHPQVTLSHSNFRLHSPDDWITNPATNGNQTAAPLYVDPATGDFREQPGSPTVNAGTSDGLTGTLDLGGAARLSGPTADIGAFELQEPAPPAPVTTGAGPQGGTPQGGTPQGGGGATTRPRFAGVRIARRSLKAKHGKVRIAVSCPKNADGYCAGKLVLARTGGAAKHKPIGSARFMLRPGQSRKLGVRLTRAARRARRLRALASVVAHDANGARQTTSAALTIRRG